MGYRSVICDVPKSGEDKSVSVFCVFFDLHDGDEHHPDLEVREVPVVKGLSRLALTQQSVVRFHSGVLPLERG